MTCSKGRCISGVIDGNEIEVGRWDEAVSDFELRIDEFNRLTKRYQVPHPGFIEKADYCVNCGEKV